MEKIADHTKTSKIEGVPVWKLEGVNDANQEIVKKTGLWVHYSGLEHDGWGLVAQDTLRNDVMAELSQHGITAQPWPELPARSPAGLFIGLSVFVLGIVIAQVAPGLGGIMIASSLFLALGLGSWMGYGNITYGTVIKKIIESREEEEYYVRDSIDYGAKTGTWSVLKD